MNATLTFPPKAPSYRSWLRLQRFFQNPIPFYQADLEKYGDTYQFSLRYSSVNILTTNPDVIQHILRKNSANYEKPVAQSEALARFVGEGVLVSRGAYHKQQRDLLQPNFHRKKLVHLVDSLQEELERYAVFFAKKIDEQEVVDVDKEMKKLTFCLMAKAIFGDSMSSTQTQEFKQYFTQTQGFFIRLVQTPFLMRWYKWNGTMQEQQEIIEQSDALLLSCIKKRRREGGSQNDLLDMLLHSTYADCGRTMTDRQLLEECKILFVAGHETTANILTWIFYILQKEPTVIAKIKAEAQEKIGDKQAGFDDLLHLEYLSQVINEALRMYPPSWITSRVAVEDDEAAGYHIPKGARVIPYIYGLHHCPKLWKDPELFRPERFSKSERKERHNFAHLPFGAGPRMCLGRHFALLQMQLIILHVIKKYDFKLDPSQKVDLFPSVTLQTRYGMRMRFAARK